MDYQTLLLKKDKGIATITLNRPGVLNALNPQLVHELKDAIEQTGAASDVKVVVITGAGKAFSAGADLEFLSKAFREWELLTQFRDSFNETMLSLCSLPLPTIALVNGFAFAGGLEILLSCDFAIASEDAQIGDQHINYGLMGPVVPVLLPRLIGRSAALDLMMSGKWLTGKQAEGLGLVYRAVPRQRLEDEADKLASSFLDKSRDAFGYIKRVVKESSHLPLQNAFKYGGEQVSEYFAKSGDPRKGIGAFLDKKGPPKF